MDGSDLHITTNTPPQVRVHGKLQRLPLPELTPAETKQLVYSVLTDAQKKRFEETMELDFSFGIRGIARFRCNVFNQRGAVAAVYRLIPEQIRGFQELGLPAVIAKLAERPRGLVLVTGPTGSGKSTTLAAMIDKINTERHEHILTIEDPIEYIHQHKNCLVNQREVHSDTQQLRPRAARRAARGPRHRADRRDARPRDGRSRRCGSPRPATSRSPRCTPTRRPRRSTASSTSSRRTSRGRSGRSCRSCSRGSSASRCCRGRRQGRVVALEILVPTSAIRNLIREDKIHQIYSSMQTGQEKLGMQTLNQSLATLFMSRQITMDTALTASSHRDELMEMINRGVGVVAGAGLGRGVGAAPGRRSTAEASAECRGRCWERHPAVGTRHAGVDDAIQRGAAPWLPSHTRDGRAAARR